MKLHQSAEDYLKNILILERRNGSVRAIDIANEMDFSKPSVSVAMKHLREKKYIHTDEDGNIILTGTGREIAETIDERNRLIIEWLVYLGVPEEVARKDACLIEHVISPESFDAIKQHTISSRTGNAGGV